MIIQSSNWDWKKEIETNEYMSPIQARIIERLHDPGYKPFRLDSGFVAKYGKRNPNFGFGGVGEVTYLRTYARQKEDGNREKWHETVARVVEGTFNLQKRYAQSHGRPWSDYKAKKHAEEMYDRIFSFKFTPPGRGLWAMGTPITEERGLYAALNNCAFVSTDKLNDLEYGYSKPFKFLMDMSMLGVGVGFDTKGAEKEVVVRGPDKRRQNETFVVPDTREGWVEATGRLIDAYFLGTNPVNFNYDGLRKDGKIITGFGGKSAGSKPLEELHQNLETILDGRVGWPITSTDIVDMMNIIGRGVVAGNVRRTAEIALGDIGDEEFLDLKNPKRHPEFLDEKGNWNHPWRWASNNSIIAEVGMDYKEIADRIMENGEPGLFWLDNARGYGRMKDPRNDKDWRVAGVNPCVEQSLESYELCNLVETFPFNHKSLEDYLRTLKFAYMYGKTVSTAETHWEQTNRIMMRNRRIGNSMSGIAQFIAEKGVDALREWSEAGYQAIQRYDEEYSDDWFAIPRSVKTTSIKPSGTVSLLAGATPGMHWPVAGEYHIRRITFAKNDQLVPHLKNAGYIVENAEGDNNSVKVEFPIHAGHGLRSESEVSMWEQLQVVSLLQNYWADNQVSATIKFDREKEGPEIEYALSYFDRSLKGISFLPKEGHKFSQPPYQPITREEYLDRVRQIKPIDWNNISIIGDTEKVEGCTNDVCEIKAETAPKVDK